MTKATKNILRLDSLSVSVQLKQIVSDISFNLTQGKFVILLGPNGAGKTTLLRAALGLVPPAAGSAELNGTPTNTLSANRRARTLAYLPQNRPLAWPNIVKDIVGLGRFAHGAAIGNLSIQDAKAVDHALTACDLIHLKNRNADTLSGGELARVHCARAFAAQTPLLIADEPIAALDPRHQHQVMMLIRNFVDGSANKEAGGALCVLHDISLAAKYADHLLWMKDGKLLANGTPEQTITSERMKEVYGVNARLNKDEYGNIDLQIDGPA